jgi:hypothetical protein
VRTLHNPLFVKEREVQRGLPLAGELGVSPNLNLPHEWGIKGVDLIFIDVEIDKHVRTM